MSILNNDCKNSTWSDYDCVITDPPFSDRVHSKATSQSKGGGTRHNDLGFLPLTAELRKWTCGLVSNAKRWSCIFSDVESVGLWKSDLEESGSTYIRTIPWVRWSSPCLNGDRPPQGFECIIVAYGKGKGRKKWNGNGNLTHFKNLCMRGAAKHKAEKPLDLVLHLVDFFSDPGELVIDPFAGSGTTGVACRILGRNFLGTELDPKWTEFGNKRIQMDPSVQSKTDKDFERFNRWLVQSEQVWKDKKQMRTHTKKVRDGLTTSE